MDVGHREHVSERFARLLHIFLTDTTDVVIVPWG